jgi:phosphoribosylanthranilate isomerase
VLFCLLSSRACHACDVSLVQLTRPIVTIGNMPETHRFPFVKVCCIASQQEASMALAAGADALGLVSSMPSGPGVIADALIAQIAKQVALQAQAVGRDLHTFLLTARQTAESIALQYQQCQTTHIQLVDAVASHELLALRQYLPGVQLVQVIHVLDADSLAEALAVAPLVDMLLLDSGNPHLAVKELGGTGRTHNWAISAQIVDQSPVPVLLAGGLNPGNAALAMRTVRPHGLDICSGVRQSPAEGGALDSVRLAAFIHAAREAGA